MRRALYLAHRGDWRVAPENTLAAMRAALAVPGCDGLEFDVQSARDGVPVLLHDDTLDRVQGIRASVDSLMASELARIGVPTLKEVLAAVGREPFLDIELKGQATASVIEVVEAGRGEPGGGLARAVISSFRIDTLAMLQERRPGWPRWLNVEVLGPAAIEVARLLGCAGISAEWRSIDGHRARAVHDAGLDLAAWTVRRRSTAQRLERLGVVAICVEAAALDG